MTLTKADMTPRSTDAIGPNERAEAALVARIFPGSSAALTSRAA